MDCGLEDEFRWIEVGYVLSSITTDYDYEDQKMLMDELDDGEEIDPEEVIQKFKDLFPEKFTEE